jgi:hypothetical protein
LEFLKALAKKTVGKQQQEWLVDTSTSWMIWMMVIKPKGGLLGKENHPLFFSTAGLYASVFLFFL